MMRRPHHNHPHPKIDLKKVLEKTVGEKPQLLSWAAYGSGIGKLVAVSMFALVLLVSGFSVLLRENCPDTRKKPFLEARVAELQEELEDKMEDADTLAREILALFPEEEVSKPS